MSAATVTPVAVPVAPMLEAGDKIGPYILTGYTLFDDNGCRIEEAVCQGTDKLWALKIKADNHYDIRYVKKLRGYCIRNVVDVPVEEEAFSGTLDDGRLWYAMRCYDRQVASDEWSRQRWQQVATDVLQFLEDFHIKLRLAHLDIKTYNILYDADADCFRVCDFEHVTESEDFEIDEPLRTYDAYHRWYYTMLGGDPDQPYESFRMDLEALGFVLSMLTWPAGESAQFLFECERRMNGGGTAGITESEVVMLRNKEIAENAPPVLLQYYCGIEELAWTAAEPPPAEFYQNLKALFTAET